MEVELSDDNMMHRITMDDIEEDEQPEFCPVDQICVYNSDAGNIYIGTSQESHPFLKSNKIYELVPCGGE